LRAFSRCGSGTTRSAFTSPPCAISSWRAAFEGSFEPACFPAPGPTRRSPYLSLPLERHDHRALIGRVPALRSNFTAYDAAYVALAEALETAVVTFDDTLARAIVRHSDVAVVGA
jgi:hypothetical protein